MSAPLPLPTTTGERRISCNVLVYDDDRSAVELIQATAIGCNVIQPKVETGDILGLLQKANVSELDICAVFLSETKDENGLSGFEIARLIHSCRNNIPIFMRLMDGRRGDDITREEQQLVAGCYTMSEPDLLKGFTDKFLYGVYFPSALVDIFAAAGKDVLSALFRSCEVKDSKPFLVYDHIITTEYTAILPAQFSFGSGFITFLIKELDAFSLIAHEHTVLSKEQADINHINQLISEVMNLYWGRARHLAESRLRNVRQRGSVSVPMVVSHKRNYISFGNKIPQLCFRYIILRDASIPAPCLVEFKIIFSNALDPRDFVSLDGPAQAELQSGSIEMF